MIHRHRAFGLDIASEIALPELADAAFEAADLVIAKRAVAAPPDAVALGGSFSYPADGSIATTQAVTASASTDAGLKTADGTGTSEVDGLSLFGGAGSISSYGLALWAMTKAPVASVAALRETAILFALLISVFILKETASIWRYIAGAVIACGVLVLKLA